MAADRYRRPALHKPEIVERKQVSNELVSYRIVCCGEKCGKQCTNAAHICHDTWHTIHVKVPDHAGILEKEKIIIAGNHEAMLAWRRQNAS